MSGSASAGSSSVRVRHRFAIRRNLLAEPGLRGDLDQFVGWVHHIATHGLSTLYSGTTPDRSRSRRSWPTSGASLAAIQPAFQTVTDASDPAIRAFMKAPASLADLGARGPDRVYALRDAPRWAAARGRRDPAPPGRHRRQRVVGPVRVDLRRCSAFAALVLAISGRRLAAAALVAVALMTKPQALPFLVPFAAWFWATAGTAAVGPGPPGGVGVAMIVVLWLPFLAAGGPGELPPQPRGYQGDIFALSLRAWNVWWLVQILGAGGAIRGGRRSRSWGRSRSATSASSSRDCWRWS